jgi:hypothetical protein
MEALLKHQTPVDMGNQVANLIGTFIGHHKLWFIHSSNVKFTPIVGVSISATFRSRSRSLGNFFFGQPSSSSFVAKTKCIANPFPLLKASRASKIAL